MSLAGVITILVLSSAVIFGLLNQPVLYESRAIQLPGGTYTFPIVGIILAAAAGAVILMLLSEAVAVGMWRRTYGRLSDRLTARERELGEIKSKKYDEVSAKIDAMREELAGEIAGLRRLVETRPTQTVVRETLREEPAGGPVHRETTVTKPR